MAIRIFTEGGATAFTDKIIKEDKTSIDVATLELPITQKIDPGDTVHIKSVSGTTIFTGVVQNIKLGTTKSVTCYDQYEVFLRRTVNDLFQNQRPEQIIESLVTGLSSLNFVSTINSGITITNRQYKDKKANIIIDELAETLFANVRVDLNGNFRLEQRGENLSSKVITDSNFVRKGSWNQDKTELVNSVIVKGQPQVFDLVQDFTSTGTETDFTLTEIPLDVEVENPVGTLKQGYVEGQGSGDYIVNRDTKKIIFDSATSSGTVRVNYTFNFPTRVESSRLASVTAYGQHDKVLEKTYINNMQEARDYADYMLDVFSDPLLSSTWIISSQTEYGDFNNWVPNELINVNDTQQSINNRFLIRKVERNFPGTMDVTVGEPDSGILFWQKEVQERVKQLEEQDDNVETTQRYELVRNNVTVSIVTSVPLQLERDLPDDLLHFGFTDREFGFAISDLVLWDHLDNDSKDRSQFLRGDSTLSGTEQYTVFGKKTDLGFDFDNATSLTYAHDSDMVVGEGSLSVWLKPDSTSNQSIVSKQTGTTTGHWDLHIASNQLVFQIFDGTAQRDAKSNSAPSTSDWQFVVCSWGSTGVSMYVNNTLQTDNDANSVTSAANVVDFIMGTSTLGGTNYDGKLADVRLYGHVLSANERTTLYNSGDGIFSNSINETAGGTLRTRFKWACENTFSKNPRLELPNLEHWYAFDNDLTDSAGSADATGTQVTFTTGLINQAGSFGGTISTALATSTVITDYPFTVSSWFNAGTTTGTQVVAGLIDISASDIYYGVGLSGNQVGIFRSNTSDISTLSTVTVSDSSWNHLVGVFTSATDAKLYLNGSLLERSVVSVSFGAGVDGVLIGAQEVATGSNYFNGLVDNVRIFSRALSTAEIGGIYNGGSGKTNKFSSWEDIT